MRWQPPFGIESVYENQLQISITDFMEDEAILALKWCEIKFYSKIQQVKEVRAYDMNSK